MIKSRITLSKLENFLIPKSSWMASDRKALMEFHIRREVREEYGLEESLFSLTGNVVLSDMRQVRALAQRFNSGVDSVKSPERFISAGELNAMGLIDEILHYVVALYREQVQPDVFETGMARLEEKLGESKTRVLMGNFCRRFPPRDVYSGRTDIPDYLAGSDSGESCLCLSLEEMLLLAIANLNPAFRPFLFLFDDSDLARETAYPGAIEELKTFLSGLPGFGPDGLNLWDILTAPARASPNSLYGQLEFMRKRWGLLLGRYMGRLLTGIDIIKEEDKPSFSGPGPSQVLDYSAFENEYERFTPDQEWMPRTVLVAKSTLVWLFQLSKKYGREITKLDQIPDEELDILAARGFTGLWLIGLWERSRASRTIKQWTGNPEAAASAYSLYDYDIAGELGGWGALANLRERCMRRGIRLGSDMVPNHTGIDSRWIIEHPNRFLQLSYPPYPTYNYSCENLSGSGEVTVQIENHYFDHSDAAVVFKRIDNYTGETRYIYHGNDGTSMPWNDTAQIDFLNPEAREAVIRTIVGVCQQFPIVRFDAAMTLAKRHIQRLWYPAPGHGGAIASRAEHSITTEEFNRRIPDEFWREVVDRCAAEAPHTLLLAEAFWMMEGYFVRTLGMHRVYNSAFMNMLKNEENEKYRATIKNTLEFDPEILKRFVNFMNNPDEETAVAQFGKGDKYFGICTLLVTMPGLPMFGHGQIEGFEEKYGMEYRRSYRNEKPDPYMTERHEREIFPLMKRRHVFSGSADFCLYDFIGSEGRVNENVFAYSNRSGDERSLVFYNNSYYAASGWIKRGAVAIPQKDGTYRQDSVYEALGLHSEGRFFTVFREQRSALWYIRSSREIAEHGLFAGLNGYEAQVFFEFGEREDSAGAESGNWETRWSMLNHELNGRGVHNLEEALLDICLAEVYVPLREILSLDRAEKLAAFFIPADFAADSAVTDKSRVIGENSVMRNAETRAQFAESFREPVLAFAAAVGKYLDGENKKYKPFAEGGDFSVPGPDEVWKEWLPRFENLLAMADEISRYKSAPDEYPAIFGKEVSSRPGLAVMAVSYLAAALLKSFVKRCPASKIPSEPETAGQKAASLAGHLRLDLVMRKCFENLRVPPDEALSGAEIALAVLSRSGSEKSGHYAEAKTPSAIASALLLENFDAGDFRKILGLNRFDDATWFNKEAFETALFLAPFFFLVESAGASAEARKKNIKVSAGVFKVFKAAEKASGYKLDELAALLSETPRRKARNSP